MKSVSAAIVVLLCSATAQAAGSPQQVDAELLEFLGSIDAEEEGWQEYLEQKPVKPVQKPPQEKSPAPKPDPKQAKAK